MVNSQVKNSEVRSMTREEIRLTALTSAAG
jgi:hypothetical protein